MQIIAKLICNILSVVLFIIELYKIEAITNLERNCISSYETARILNELTMLDFYILIVLTMGQLFVFYYLGFVFVVPLLAYEINKIINHKHAIICTDIVNSIKEKKLEIFIKLFAYAILFILYTLLNISTIHEVIMN
ncbi:ER-derived vesicles protein ERV15 [Astathelohania contejeani]|uniref:ER-derived vesicles protein ERV15 n=1 Tax=Astathelohania contejeani TaxID=164912 RepID=A0ABQ7HW94_9MICR|nr:ER-derived vesicles protein ERV15 [Thelohania contejeani]